MNGRRFAGTGFGLLLALTAGYARADFYGLDITPGSVFHHGEWNHYGTDPVPTSTTHEAHDFGVKQTYGWDVVPSLTHPHLDHRQNVLIIETFQQLTGDRSTEPATPRQRTQRPRTVR